MTFDKWRELAQTVGVVLIPIMVTIMGNAVVKSNANRAVDAQIVQSAVGVLERPVDTTRATRALRLWAVQELGRHSDMPLSAEAESSLVKSRSLATPVELPLPGAAELVFLCDTIGRNCQRIFSSLTWVMVQPIAARLLLGDSMEIAVVPMDANGKRLSLYQRTVSWTTSNADVANVGPREGGHAVVHARAVGSATITAMIEGRSGTDTIHVVL